MAINPAARYPTQTAVDGDWPYNAPKNIVAPGDDTGTPWDEDVVKDLWGFQQALLLQAGITPTDVPETPVASQYLDALNAIFTRGLSATTAILTSDLAGVNGVKTIGYSTVSDGGGATWYATGVTAPGKSGTTELGLGFVYDTNGLQFAISPGPIRPRQYGAVADGVANDVAAIANVVATQFSRGGGEVYMDAGTYFCDSQLTTSDLVSFRGDDEATLLTFVGASGAFPDVACIVAKGSAAALPGPSADIDVGAQFISFSASHTLVSGDLFQVYNATNSSYDPTAATHRAGEFFEVAEVVSSSTLDVTRPAFATTSTPVTGSPDGYAFAATSAEKITPVRVAFRNMEIRGLDDVRPAIFVRYGRQCVFSNLRITNSREALISLQQCYDSNIVDVSMLNATDGAFGNHGIRLTNCQLAYITRASGGGRNGMLTLEASPASTTNGVPNRLVYVTDCNAMQHGDAEGSVRVSANSEYLSIASSTLAGVLLGGDHHRIVGCRIEGQTSASPGSRGAGWALAMEGMTGLDVVVQDCQLVAVGNVTNDLIQWNDSTSIMFRAGAFRMSGCTVTMGAYTGGALDMTSTAATIFPSVDINDTVFQSANASQCTFSTTASDAWDRVSIRSTRFDKVHLSVGGAGVLDVDTVVSTDSTVDGVKVLLPVTSPHASRSIRFANCNISGADLAGILVIDDACTVQCVSVTSLNNNVNGVKASERSSFAFDPASGAGVTAITLANCVFGDDQAVATQTFAYHYDNVDDVVDSRTTILGGLPVIRNASILDTLCNVWDEDAEIQRSTGAAGFSGGDPSAAPTGAQDLALGNGSDSGMWIKSGATGTSRWVAGDTTDPDRFVLECDHTTSQFQIVTGGVSAAVFNGGGINPATTATRSIGESLVRWGGLYGGELHAGRVFLDDGSFVLGGSAVLNANWGASASIGIGAGSRDSLLKLTPNSGVTPGGNPTITYTFQDGATTGSKIPYAFVMNQSTVIASWDITVVTSTVVVIRFLGTPTAATLYGFVLMLVWADD